MEGPVRPCQPISSSTVVSRRSRRSLPCGRSASAISPATRLPPTWQPTNNVSVHHQASRVLSRSERPAAVLNKEVPMAQYRAGVIGLGWMGLLYDLATRIPDRFDVDDVDRPTPVLDVHRTIRHHEHPGERGAA